MCVCVCVCIYTVYVFVGVDVRSDHYYCLHKRYLLSQFNIALNPTYLSSFRRMASIWEIKGLVLCSATQSQIQYVRFDYKYKYQPLTNTHTTNAIPSIRLWTDTIAYHTVIDKLLPSKLIHDKKNSNWQQHIVHQLWVE